MSLTCYSCAHSFGTDERLLCSRNMQPAPLDPCFAFCYEPGTDESERNTVAEVVERG